jgi:hypothetical protein
MRKRQWALPLALAGLLWGCATDPTLFPKLQQSLQTVQAYYDPLLKQWGADDEKVQMAVVAADTTLKMISDLQKQWRPDPKAVEQAQLQTAQAVKLAQQAGVPEAGGLKKDRAAKNKKKTAAPATAPVPTQAPIPGAVPMVTPAAVPMVAPAPAPVVTPTPATGASGPAGPASGLVNPPPEAASATAPQTPPVATAPEVSEKGK